MKDWIKNNAVAIITLLSVLFIAIYQYGKLSDDIRRIERQVDYLHSDVSDLLDRH